MKSVTRHWLIVALINTVACSGYAGVIPSSLIQSDQEIAKIKKCENLEKQQSEILKKMSELKREQERYEDELKKAGENYCNGTQE